jgi:hypothetical protein
LYPDYIIACFYKKPASDSAAWYFSPIPSQARQVFIISDKINITRIFAACQQLFIREKVIIALRVAFIVRMSLPLKTGAAPYGRVPVINHIERLLSDYYRSFFSCKGP